MAMDRAAMGVAVLALAVGGCADVLGIGEFVDRPAGEAGGGDGDGGSGGEAGQTGAPVTPGWANAYGAQGIDVGSGVGVDGSDTVVLAGTIEGQVDFGGGVVGAESASAVFAVRLAADGSHERSIASRGTAQITVADVAVAGDGTVAVVGSYHDGWLAFVDEQAPPAAAAADVFVATLSDTLTPRFLVGYNAAGEQRAHAVAIDPGDGSVLVGGSVRQSFEGGASSGPDEEDAFVMKLDAQGQILWAHDWGDGSDQRVTALAVDGAGHVFVGGSFAGSMDTGAGPMTAAAVDAFVVELDNAGNHIRSRRFGVSAVHEVSALAATGDGVVMVGAFVGTTQMGDEILDSGSDNLDSDMFVVRLDAAGEVVWASHLGANGADHAHDVVVDDDGGVVVSGAYSGALPYGPEPSQVLFSEGGDDAFVMSLDSAGQPSWVVGFGRNDDDRARAIALDGAGNAVLAGTFQVGFLLGEEKVTGIGSDDIFVAKLLR